MNVSDKMNKEELRLFLELTASANGWKLKPKPVKPLTEEQHKSRYANGRDQYKKYRSRQEIEDKARLPDTNQGKVPLVLGKYGMTVEEYLEWKVNQLKRKK